jgi:hypothetical protein
MLAAFRQELLNRQQLVQQALQANTRDAQLVLLATWIHAPAVVGRGTLFSEQLASVVSSDAQ